MRPTDPRQSRPFSRTLPAMVLCIGVLIAMVLAVAACGGEESGATVGGEESGATVSNVEQATIVGVWEDSTGYTFEFTVDGRFVSEDTADLNMTYVIQGNEITFSSDFGSGTTVEFSLDGDTLEIEDYETGEFETATRVE